MPENQSISNSTFTAAQGVYNLIVFIENNPARGTGISLLLSLVHNLVGPIVPPTILKYSIGLQNNLFGGYPSSSEIAPDIVFAVLFFIIGLVHLSVFVMNCVRGHYFWISIGWVVYSFMRTVGFTLRALWATNITLLPIGLTSEVLSIVPSNIIVSLNLMLAQKLFTWRHPVGGSRKLFWGFMIGLYTFVVLSIGVVIAASFYSYLHFVDNQINYNMNFIVEVTSVTIISYSLTAVSLIGLSFWFPTSKDENLYTYQPWWIESFSPFYFVEAGAAQRAEETFMKRNHNHRHAVRVIAATHHHYKMVKGLSNQRGDLSHNKSLLIIIITTLLILVGAIGRCIVAFQDRENSKASAAAKPYFMFICWGGFEVIINVLYIVGRVDLRFYRPDRLPSKVRAIITAEQSYYPSDFEDDVKSNSESDVNHLDDNEISSDPSILNPRFSLNPSKLTDKKMIVSNESVIDTVFYF